MYGNILKTYRFYAKSSELQGIAKRMKLALDEDKGFMETLYDGPFFKLVIILQNKENALPRLIIKDDDITLELTLDEMKKIIVALKDKEKNALGGDSMVVARYADFVSELAFVVSQE